jgi:hypothetical protein
LPPQSTGTGGGPVPDDEVVLLLPPPQADNIEAPISNVLNAAIHRLTFTKLP